MSKINMREFAERKAKESSIEIETEDETFLIPAPELWSDDLLELAKGGRETNLELCVALLGGEENYARFKKAGGGQAMLGAIIEEAKGTSLGK